MINALDVYLYGEHVATITRRARALRLAYLPEYIHAPRSVPISVEIPVTPASPSSVTIERFLENLLPDRADVRARWASDAGLSSDSAFDLLGVYGADVAGALEFTPAGASRRTAAQLAPISDSQIGARIRQIREDDSNWLSNRPQTHAFSLGGAQGKFALARHNDQWWEAAGTHPSTHIIKPGVRSHPDSDVTEHIVMRLAREIGIETAHTEIQFFDGEHALVVERFDRHRDGDQLLRIHQEDLAQATGTSTLQKYESKGGPGYRQLFALFDRVLEPKFARDAKRRFAELLVFSWVIGHGDGHAKNSSLTHLPGGSFLSPFYDLNSSLPFQLPESVRQGDYRLFDKIELSFNVDGGYMVGEQGRTRFASLEKDAELEPGYLADFLVDRVAIPLQPKLNAVIRELPGELAHLPVVKNFPFATYAQLQRVNALLA